MDVERGDFKFDFASGKVTSSVAKNGFLDPVIANEGTRVILSDGTEVSYNPPPAKPVMPDWSEYKSIKHLFNRTDYHFFPVWLYHPKHEPVIVKNAREAHEGYGVRLLERSDEEQAMYGGGKYRWQFDSEWRPTPYEKKAKFDPLNAGNGKNYIPKAPDPQIAQHALIEQLVSAMQSGQNELLLQLVTALGTAAARPAPAVEQQSAVAMSGALGAHPVDEERAAWEAQAKDLGIKIDGRWKLDRLKTEVTAAFDKRAAAEQPAISVANAAVDPIVVMPVFPSS